MRATTSGGSRIMMGLLIFIFLWLIIVTYYEQYMIYISDADYADHTKYAKYAF